LTGQFRAERRGGGPIPWLFAGVAIVVAVFAIAFAVTLTGNSTPLGPSHHHPPVAAPLVTASVTTLTPTPSHTPKPARKRAPSPKPSSAPSATPPPPSPKPLPAVSPRPAKPTPSASVLLAATVSVDGGWHFSNFGLVVFEVQDTGSAATGQVTVTITLPAGASMSSDGGAGQGRSGADWGSGWTCQPTSAGATCQHDVIPAGGQTMGAIYITLSGTSACGQPVELSAASGSASASAQSSGGISC